MTGGASRKPRSVGGVGARDHVWFFPCREAPPCGRGASLKNSRIGGFPIRLPEWLHLSSHQQRTQRLQEITTLISLSPAWEWVGVRGNNPLPPGTFQPGSLPCERGASQRTQRLFPFSMTETDPAAEEVPVAVIPIDVVLMSVVILGATV